MPTIAVEKAREALKAIRPYVHTTPVISNDLLSQMAGIQVFLKCETLQRTGSFKVRGATHCVLKNKDQAKRAGVITASAGNHAQGVAMICHELGIRATILMPTPTPPIKVQNTKRWGAQVELVGQVYDDAFDEAVLRAKRENLLLIHPFQDPVVMAGQATIALELDADGTLSQVDAFVVSVGGGGLISGCGSVIKALYPKVKVYGVTAKNAPATFESFKTRKAVERPVQFTLAEGVAAKRSDEFMLGYLKDTVDDMIALDEEAISHAISLLAEHAKLIVEGSGALPVGAVLRGLIPEKRVVCVLSGGNIDLPALGHVLQHGLVQQGRLVRLVITLADRPGALRAVTEVLAKVEGNIQQIFHQRSKLSTGIGEVEIEVELETRGTEHALEIESALRSKDFRVQRVT